jgi:glucose/arabinose dehydrogenase
MRRLLAIALAAALIPTALSAARPAASPTAVKRKTIASNLSVPWGIAFLPDGSALVSQRETGAILRIPAGGGPGRKVHTIGDVDTNSGEGGMLGLAVSPDYARDKRVYAYYTSTKGDNRIVRFTLGGSVDPIVTGIHRAGNHNGGRLAFGPDGKLYASTGDAGNGPDAQVLDSLNGKILRLNPDGSAPADNPFKGSIVFTLGHRNVEGLAFDGDGRLWATEFGEVDTDEVNLIRAGRNYGWPQVEGRGDTQGGKFTNPKVTWSPTGSASPSGAAIVKGRLYVGALAGASLYRVGLRGTTAGKPKRLLRGTYGRIRTVVRAPGGGLWIATSNRDGRGSPAARDDRILQIPAL